MLVGKYRWLADRGCT